MKYYIYQDYGYTSEKLLTADTKLDSAIKMAKRAVQYEIFNEHIEVITFSESQEMETHYRIDAYNKKRVTK